MVNWIEATDEGLVYLSVLTLGEVRKGIFAAAPASRRVALEAWLETGLRSRFAGRILTVDQAVADRWGLVAGQAQANGMTLPVVDGLLAATALHHGYTVVTRNVGDFVRTGVALLDAWQA